MCSTCNYNNFETVMVNGTAKLEGRIGVGKMVIRCDVTGRNWELGVKDDDRDRFTLYSCPTCGKKLR